MAGASNGHFEPRQDASPATSKLRNSTKDTACRNVILYGQCRRPNCPFYHPSSSTSSPNPAQAQIETMKKRFNVDSPNFVPSTSLAPEVNTPSSKGSSLSPRAASAAPFKPKNITPVSSATSLSSASAQKSYNPNAPDWTGGEIQDFLPQGFNNLNLENGSDYGQNDVYGSINDSTNASSFAPNDLQQDTYQYNPTVNGAQHTSYVPNTANSALQHHLYAPLDSYYRNLKPYQRTTKDVFISEDLRQKLHKKTEATLRIFPNSQLPTIEYYHSLTPLEVINHRRSTPNAAVSTVFRAVSDQDGKTYCLRRIHEVRMLRDSPAAQAVASLKMRWANVAASSVVTAHLAFTTQIFGDTSVIVASDFFPDSITLREKHSPANLRSANRMFSLQVSEDLLWNYMVQIANALRAIHAAGLAARYMDAKRWLVTDENRIRYNACGLAEILDPSSLPVQELQRADLHGLGNLIFTLATSNINTKIRPAEHFARTFSPRLQSTVEWLQHQSPTPTLSPENTNANAGTITDLLHILSPDLTTSLDASLRLSDTLQSSLARELENARLVRLLFKLSTITDRPEYDSDPAWRDQGPRTAIKLFRDFVFHQVDAAGNPVSDMGWMLTCLNKLDVGVEEKITLVSRNEATVIVVSYREVKQAVEGAWGELMSRRGM